MKMASATTAVLIFGLILLGCGEDPARAEGLDYQPVILLVMRDLPPSPQLPPLFSRDRSDVSAGMLLDDSSSVDLILDSLITDAAAAGLLTAVITDEPGIYRFPRDHIGLWNTTDGRILSAPDEIASSLEDSMVFGSMDFHRALYRLHSLYKPDLMLIDVRMTNASKALQIADLWATPGWLENFTLVVTRPSNAASRGWCLMAGSRIDGTVPRGLTESGLYTTVRMLAGMEWLSRIPGSIPAASLIRDRNLFWRYSGD